MEPENHLIEKENNRSNHHFQVLAVNLRGWQPFFHSNPIKMGQENDLSETTSSCLTVVHLPKQNICLRNFEIYHLSVNP